MADDGSRVWLAPGGEVHVRPGNKMLRDIPAADRRLEIGCYDGGSRSGGPHLVAIIDTDWRIQARNHPEAHTTPGVLRTLCRCPAGAHDIDLERAREAADRVAHRNRKGRYVDVRSVVRCEPQA